MHHCLIIYVNNLGAIKSGHRSTNDLWTLDGFGADILACIMSEKRFLFLLRFIRFDDIRGRLERRKIDNMTAIRKLFEDFVNNCKSCYKISEYATIDEKLQSFRGRCPFRVYMPNKPAKYGLKLFALVDSINYYTKNLELYTGNQPLGPFTINNSALSVVKRLIEPIKQTGRNITIDNWFTSVALADDLLKDRITLIGTIRKNKRELPPDFISIRNRELYSSYFAFSQNKTLVSYKAKKNKVVLLLSTMHNNKCIDESTGNKRKPEIIQMYNATKGGVDTMDWMTENYSVARRSARWPLTLFYSILNIGGLNAQVIHSENNKAKITRLLFLKTLGRELMTDQLNRRATIDVLPRTIKIRLRQYCEPTNNDIGAHQRIRATGRCAFCEHVRDRKTKKVCTNCAKLICKDHLIEICPECFDIM